MAHIPFAKGSNELVPLLRHNVLVRSCHPFEAAVLELGALFGALSAGVLADRYSRRQSIFAACGERMPLFHVNATVDSRMQSFSA